jgi:hypothetical protein
MPDLFALLAQLRGRTLYTEARRKPFTLEVIGLDKVRFTPLETGVVGAPSYRKNVEGAYRLAIEYRAKYPDRPLRATNLRSASPHNSPYLLAAFKACGFLD